MSSEKPNENQDQPAEIETEQLDEVAGGRKALHTMVKPKAGVTGIIADPCEGGE